MSTATLNITVTEAMISRLQGLQHDVHAGSMTDVVVTALTIYAAIVEQRKNGCDIYFRKNDGSSEQRLSLFLKG